LGPNILLSTLFRNTLHPYSPLNVRNMNFHTHTNQQVKLNFIYFSPHVYKKKTGRRKILKWIVATILWSSTPFLREYNFICYSRSQIF
jgi:hypothetical protein